MTKAAWMTQAESGLGRHGGRLAEAMRAFPDAPAPWLDLSTGINPIAWRPREPIAIDPGPLPDVAALARLEAAAAAAFGADPARVVALPGSEIALRLLPSLGLPQPFTAVVPTYGTHREIAAEQIDRAAFATARSGTVILANPNNPDGHTLSASVTYALALHQQERGGWLVVDEAFADVMPDTSVGFAPQEGLPLVVLRSFGKFFGLAGIRLGFLIAPAEIVARARALLGDWPVSAQAIAWGTAAYEDRTWIADTREGLAGTATRLDTLLARHGLVAEGACPLFRWVRHPEARAIFERLARAGILTRPFDDQPDWLRFGLPGSAADFDRLDRALG
jgi:cobalamin biosynthesis protein CobC